MSLQTGKQAAIESVKEAFERAAEMDGRSPEDITNELATDIIDAVVALIMTGEVNTLVKTPLSDNSSDNDERSVVGNGSGKVS